MKNSAKMDARWRKYLGGQIVSGRYTVAVTPEELMGCCFLDIGILDHVFRELLPEVAIPVDDKKYLDDIDSIMVEVVISYDEYEEGAYHIYVWYKNEHMIGRYVLSFHDIWPDCYDGTLTKDAKEMDSEE